MIPDKKDVFDVTNTSRFGHVYRHSWDVCGHNSHASDPTRPRVLDTWGHASYN